MMQIIPLFTAFFFVTNITVAHNRFVSIPRRKVTTKATKPTSWKTTNLEMFAESLNEKCDFGLLDAVYKDLKVLWTIKEGNEYTSMEMDNVKEFLNKILELYNKCFEKERIEFDREWEIYVKIFGKKYNAKEKEMRKEIFKKNKEDVEKHNELYRSGTVTYSASLNHLSDWTEQELEKVNGFRPPNATLGGHSGRRVPRYPDGLIWRDYYYNPHNAVPASVDWRTKGNYVSPVKFQGSCGSCYAMAGLGALEAYHKKKTGVFVLLSTQNILDCTWHLGSNGCVDGSSFTVFEYAHSTGVMSNSRYPYTMNASRNCRWRREDVVATNRGYYVVEEGSELALRNAVADHGPVAVGIGASHLHSYGSGVFNIANCGEANHVALVVGYGTDPIYGDYWIVKNSWGFWWGEDGYLRLSRNNGNMCHIASYAFFPY